MVKCSGRPLSRKLKSMCRRLCTTEFVWKANATDSGAATKGLFHVADKDTKGLGLLRRCVADLRNFEF